MTGASALRLALLLPDLLGTYGDSGNATVLERRLAWRGIGCEVTCVTVGHAVPTEVDLYVLGGGEDEAQVAAADILRSSRLAQALERGAQVFAVCAGLQLLGTRFQGPQGHWHEGLGVLDVETDRLHRRAVGEVVSRLPDEPAVGTLTGFENHIGRTTLGDGVEPLARVVRGVGNGGTRGTDGVRTDRVLATYLHGPVLARNPALADLQLERVLGLPLAPLHHDAHDQLRSQLLQGGPR